jgi:hypothetical protein
MATMFLVSGLLIPYALPFFWLLVINRFSGFRVLHHLIGYSSHSHLFHLSLVFQLYLMHFFLFYLYGQLGKRVNTYRTSLLASDGNRSVKNNMRLGQMEIGVYPLWIGLLMIVIVVALLFGL